MPRVGMEPIRRRALIEATAETFGIKPACWRRLKAAHLGVGKDDPYAVLGLEPGATTAAVQARYRELMRENHPDTLMARGVPASLIKIADGRAATINAAYEAILAEARGYQDRPGAIFSLKRAPIFLIGKAPLLLDAGG